MKLANDPLDLDTQVGPRQLQFAGQFLYRHNQTKCVEPLVVAPFRDAENAGCKRRILPQHLPERVRGP